jgi:hypothetical protein
VYIWTSNQQHTYIYSKKSRNDVESLVNMRVRSRKRAMKGTSKDEIRGHE